MANKVYVGNLSYNATEDDLRELFQEYGSIVSIKIITDAYTGQSKGFSFIEMENESEASSAISSLNGQDFKGRQIKVSEARENKNRGGYRQDNRRF